MYNKIWLSFVQVPRFTFFIPPHFGRLVFELLVFWGPTDYVYKIWLCLIQGPSFSLFDPTNPILGG